MSKFYPLEPEEWLSISSQLTFAETKVLLRLRTIDPFGDRYKECSTKKLSDALNLNQRTVQKAIIKLGELDLIDFEFSGFRFKVKTSSEKRRLVDRQANCTPPNKEKDSGVETAYANCSPPERTVRRLGVPVDRNRNQKSSSSKASKTPNTLNTINTDQIRSDDKDFKDRNGAEKEKDRKVEDIEIQNIDPELRNFIVQTIERQKGKKLTNPEFYVDKCLKNDLDHWRSLYHESNMPQPKIRDPVGEDFWRLEQSLSSAIKVGDYDFAIAKLKTNPEQTVEIFAKHPEWRKLLCP